MKKDSMVVVTYVTEQMARDEMQPLILLWPDRTFEVAKSQLIANSEPNTATIRSVWVILMGDTFYTHATPGVCDDLMDPDQDATYVASEDQWECNTCLEQGGE